MLLDGKREDVTGRLLIPELSEPKQQPEQTAAEYELALQKYRDQLNHIGPKVPGWVYTTN